MVIFHSYVSLPEGIRLDFHWCSEVLPFRWDVKHKHLWLGNLGDRTASEMIIFGRHFDIPGLVNIQKTMERSTIFCGKTHYCDWAIFNSKLLTNYQRVNFDQSMKPNPGIIPFPCRHSMLWSYEAWLWKKSQPPARKKTPTTSCWILLGYAGLLVIQIGMCSLITYHFDLFCMISNNVKLYHHIYLGGWTSTNPSYFGVQRSGLATGFWPSCIQLPNGTSKRCAGGLPAYLRLTMTCYDHPWSTSLKTQINLDQLGIV